MPARPPLILASASPRRQALLRAGGLDFTIQISGIDETQFLSGPPHAVALKTAVAKADAIAQSLPPDSDPNTLILAADTIVVAPALGASGVSEIFNKPADRAEAQAMLTRLSGRTHEVITGLVLQRAQGEALAEAVRAQVTFNPLTPQFIADYLASGEADDKAGAYGIQGLGAHLVAAVDGDLTGVIGLPLARLAEFYSSFTNLPLFETLTPRAAAQSAFPELALLPPATLVGIPT